MSIHKKIIAIVGFIVILTGCSNMSLISNAEKESLLNQQVTNIRNEPSNKRETKSQPSWVLNIPVDSEFYYGISFLHDCKSATVCRKKGETEARIDLRKRISVQIQSKQSIKQKAVESNRGSFTRTEYQNVIKEKVTKNVISEVEFDYYYSKSDQSLYVLAKMPREDRIDREMKKFVELNLAKFDRQLVIGPFPLKGEKRESLLSYYTGMFITEQLTGRRGNEVTFLPNKLKEGLNEYLSRISENKSILYGAYFVVGNDIKFTAILKGEQQTFYLKGFKIPISSLVNRLRSISRIETIGVDPKSIKMKTIYFAYEPNNENHLINEENAVATFKLGLENALREKGFDISHSGEIQYISASNSKNLKTFQAEHKIKHNSLIVVISLNGRINNHSGFLFKGVCTVSMKTSVFDTSGQKLFSTVYDSKLLLDLSPSKMTQMQHRESYIQAIRKGISEKAADEFMNELLTVLATIKVS
jgi:hypothetical protein